MTTRIFMQSGNFVRNQTYGYRERRVIKYSSCYKNHTFTCHYLPNLIIHKITMYAVKIYHKTLNLAKYSLRMLLIIGLHWQVYI